MRDIIENYENKVSREIGMQVLMNRYGKNTTFTLGDLYDPWDFDVNCPVTSMTVEMKFRKDYTMEELDSMPDGPAVELSKANNPKNKNTILLYVSADGVCRMRDITGYTSTKVSPPHPAKTIVDGEPRMICTEWAHYTEWDDEWIDMSVRNKYLEEKQRIKDLQSKLIKEIKNKNNVN